MQLLPLLMLAASPALACLQLKGYIVNDPILGGPTTDSSIAIDNGQVVCDINWDGFRTDQDGHWSLGCLPGYVYAYSKDGTKAWFKNPSIPPGGEWAINIARKVDKYCCHGACEDKGVKISCTDYSWNFTTFC